MNNSLIEELKKDGWLKTPEIIEAFKKIRRTDFMPEEKKNLAYLNEALPIGFNQTISQPLVVAFMIELLKPKEGNKIMDIGSGSGWTTALLSYLVGKKGKVIAIERISQLKEFGRKNTAKYNFIEKNIAEFHLADGYNGWPEKAPYDGILCSAQAKFIPESWKEQLKKGGRIIVPMENSIYLFEKENEEKFQSEKFPGFSFVPLIEKL